MTKCKRKVDTHLFFRSLTLVKLTQIKVVLTLFLKYQLNYQVDSHLKNTQRKNKGEKEKGQTLT